MKARSVLGYPIVCSLAGLKDADDTYLSRWQAMIMISVSASYFGCEAKQVVIVLAIPFFCTASYPSRAIDLQLRGYCG